MIGQRFGRLVVIEQVESYKGRRFLCLCNCGNEKVVRGGDLRAGGTKSCGCLAKEVQSNTGYRMGVTYGHINGLKTGHINGLKAIVHGHTAQGKVSSTYTIWCKIKTRCYNPNHKTYRYYGARGVVVCDRWKDNFEAFLQDMGERPQGTIFSRIDNNGNYEPGNCEWSIPKKA